MLISLKNTYIWKSYEPNKAHMPTHEHTFSGHNSASFGLIELKLFMGAHESIIYRLIKRNLMFNAYIPVFIFWAGKWAWPKCGHQRVWGTGWNFWVHSFNIEIMHPNVSGMNPQYL